LEAWTYASSLLLPSPTSHYTTIGLVTAHDITRFFLHSAAVESAPAFAPSHSLEPTPHVVLPRAHFVPLEHSGVYTYTPELQRCSRRLYNTLPSPPHFPPRSFPLLSPTHDLVSQYRAPRPLPEPPFHMHLRPATVAHSVAPRSLLPVINSTTPLDPPVCCSDSQSNLTCEQLTLATRTVRVSDLAALDVIDQGALDVPVVVDHSHQGAGRAAGTTIVDRIDAHVLP
jgi:hypothetical protein